MLKEDPYTWDRMLPARSASVLYSIFNTEMTPSIVEEESLGDGSGDGDGSGSGDGPGSGSGGEE